MQPKLFGTPKPTADYRSAVTASAPAASFPYTQLHSVAGGRTLSPIPPHLQKPSLLLL